MKELTMAIDRRFLEHFAHWFGFVTMVTERKNGFDSDKIYRKTALLDEVFGFEGVK